MDAGGAANSEAMKDLLGRQLASISDTLARASSRRDAEIREMMKQKALIAPAVKHAPASLSTSCSTSGAKGAGFKAAGGEMAGVEKTGQGPAANDAEAGKSDSANPDNSLVASLHGGYASGQEDPKKMLASFDRTVSALAALNVEPQRMPVRAEQPRSTANENDDPRKMLADMPQFSAGSDHAFGKDSFVLADLERALSNSDGTERDKFVGFDPSRAQAEFDRTSAALSPDGEGDSLGTMLAELAGRPTSTEAPRDDTDHHPGLGLEEMLADLDRQTAQREGNGIDCGGEDLDALHSRLTGTLSPEPALQLTPVPQSPVLGAAALELSDQPSAAVESTDVKTSEGKPDPAIVPYVVAMMLESEGVPWEYVAGWMKYLFSSGPDGHEAIREKDKVVKLADEQLNEIIQRYMEEEAAYQEKASIAARPRRLIVSNIAADAVMEDLEQFFFRHRFVIENFKILPDRDPIRRTQTAHVEMYKREAAIQASYMTGNIFGLMLKISLAMEEDD